MIGEIGKFDVNGGNWGYILNNSGTGQKPLPGSLYPCEGPGTLTSESRGDRGSRRRRTVERLRPEATEVIREMRFGEFQGSSIQGQGALRCDTCWSYYHVKINCSCDDKTCFNCGVRGHLSVFCKRARPKGLGTRRNMRQSNASGRINNIEPFYLILKIYNIDGRFEIDMDLPVTFINSKEFQSQGRNYLALLSFPKVSRSI
ncbi:hypothetical protein RF11_08389 [Thelohanellus kitauei]|uniref:CCHC-type domain-containing protein n=1 Tax=Thelohanellus kitauei TaxID=669202 RepID=A0A0C2IPZ9_THEKT|nr:hypothetical protein RF11_08389 [Thelohanellus kitauei]